MTSILNGTGQLVALLLRTLNLAIYAFLVALALLAMVLGLSLGMLLYMTDEGAKRAMLWGQA